MKQALGYLTADTNPINRFKGQTRDGTLLTDNMPSGLEGQLNYGLIVVWGCLMKHRKYVLPTWPDVGGLWVYHLSHTPDHHVSYSGRPTWDDTCWYWQVQHQEDTKDTSIYPQSIICNYNDI